MAMNRRIVAIILEEVNSVEQRCPGYREELVATIGDIVEAERQHKVQSTNIQQKINEKCDATGRYLADRRAAQRSDG